MPKKKTSGEYFRGQCCRCSLRECIVTRQQSSAGQKQSDSSSGRGQRAPRMPEASVVPVGRVLTETQKGVCMPITNALIGLPRPKRNNTQIIIQESDSPARVLIFPYRVEIDVRPVPKRAA